MKTKESMDFLGKALKAYSQGDRSKFYFKDNSEKLFEHDLRRYFRKKKPIFEIRKKIIEKTFKSIEK